MRIKRISTLVLALLMTTVVFSAGVLGSGTFDYGNVAPEDRLEYINYDGAVPIVNPGYDITLKIGVNLETGFPCNVTDNWLWDFIKDQLGINLVIEQIMDLEKQNLLFASNQVPDLLFDVSLSTSQIVTYGISEKQLLSYTPYLEGYMPGLKARYDADPNCAINYIASTDGDMFMSPRVLDDTTIVGSYIRNSWIEALGLETPTTLDEFTEVMKAFRDADPEFLGVDKVYPIGGGYDSEYSNPIGVLTEAFGYRQNPYWKDWRIAAGYLPTLRIDDEGVDTYGLPIMDDVFYYVLEYQNAWYNENLYCPEYFTTDSTTVRADTAAGYCGWVNTSEGVGETPGKFTPGGNAEWRMLAPLTSNWNSTPTSTNYPIYGTSGFYIGGNTKYPEVCCRLIDMFYNTDWDVIMMNGPIEGDSRTPTYGYKGWSWGFDKNGNEAVVIEGEENSNTYKWEKLMPTYLDTGYLYTFDAGARWKSMVSGTTIEPESKDFIIERAKQRLEEDPVKYAGEIFTITQFDARGAYSGNGHDPILRYVYRDEETNQTIADLDAILSPYIKEQIALFISGRRTLSQAEFDAFRDELRMMGIDDYQAILAQEYQDYLAKLG